MSNVVEKRFWSIKNMMEAIFMLGTVNSLADISHISLPSLAQAFLKSW
jgi:hypothetical protein